MIQKLTADFFAINFNLDEEFTQKVSQEYEVILDGETESFH